MEKEKVEAVIYRAIELGLLEKKDDYVGLSPAFDERIKGNMTSLIMDKNFWARHTHEKPTTVKELLDQANYLTVLDICVGDHGSVAKDTAVDLCAVMEMFVKHHFDYLLSASFEEVEDLIKSSPK
jgi:hypothetical protein